MKEYDVAIIGAGPAGLTAALYSARYMLKTIVIGEIAGSELTEAYEVENFPTHKKISGFEIVNKIADQVRSLGVKIVERKVEKIERKEQFIIDGEIKAKTIIVAIGRKKRKAGIEGEDRFVGKGVSYCATCDAAFYMGKKVAVVGGGDAALTSALLLSQFASKVYIVYRRDKFFRAEPIWVKKVEENDKIEPIFNSIITKINGDDKVKSIVINGEKEMEIDGVFIEVGSVPDTKFIEMIGVKNRDGYIVVDKEQRTDIKGIYACGDVTDNSLKQAITAAAEGAIAAASAYNDIRRWEK